MTRLIKRNLKIFEELLISKDNEVCLPKTNIKACGATESKIYKKLIRADKRERTFKSFLRRLPTCFFIVSLSALSLCSTKFVEPKRSAVISFSSIKICFLTVEHALVSINQPRLLILGF